MSSCLFCGRQEPGAENFGLWTENSFSFVPDLEEQSEEWLQDADSYNLLVIGMQNLGTSMFQRWVSDLPTIKLLVGKKDIREEIMNETLVLGYLFQMRLSSKVVRGMQGVMDRLLSREVLTSEQREFLTLLDGWVEFLESLTPANWVSDMHPFLDGPEFMGCSHHGSDLFSVLFEGHVAQFTWAMSKVASGELSLGEAFIQAPQFVVR